MYVDKRLNSNIWKYYAYSFLSTIQFYGPIYVLFFQKFGLSFTQIMLFLSVYGVTTLVVEIPTGILSDYVGRKKTLFFGSLSLLASFAVFVIGTEYWHFIAAYVLMGLARSLQSGTMESLLYDSLLNAKRQADYKKIAGKATFYSKVALTLSFLFGGYLYVSGFRLPYAVTAAAAGVLVLLTLSFTEPYRKKPMVGHSKHLEESIKLVAMHPKLRTFSAYSVLVITGFVLSYFTDQPYMSLIGLNPEHFGIVLGAASIIIGLSAKYAYKIEDICGKRMSLVLPPVLIGAGYILSSQFSFLFGFAFIWMFALAEGMFRPLVSDYMNTYIKSSNRATVLSIQAAITNLSFTIFSPIIGYLVDAYSLQTAFILEGIIILVLGIWLVLIMKFGKKA